ncbi:MAG: hypothetical protein JWO69_437 [Thermoleophilia bacterium]|nr:hypothetical protein [Thermoleophilia bacterium]
MRAGGVLAAGTALLVIAACVVAVAAMASDGTLDDGSRDLGPTFSTTASGTVQVPASSATTTIRLDGCGAGPGLAVQRANGRFAAMSRAWRELGVPQRAIARGGVTTMQRSEKEWCTELAAVVRVEDLDQVDEVLTGLARYPRGIRGITGPTFDYDPAKLEEGALDEAMRVARSKADDAARRAGTKVIGVGSIREGGVNVDRPAATTEAFAGDVAGAAVDASALRSVATAISGNSGEATATVSVEAVFRLEE